MTVVTFPTHYLYRCGRDDPECEGCMFCEGGLGLCVTCGGTEGDMPSDCPQRKMTRREMEMVMRGQLDFRAGQWMKPIVTGRTKT